MIEIKDETEETTIEEATMDNGETEAKEGHADQKLDDSKKAEEAKQ